MTHSTGPWKHPKRAPLILTPEDDNRGPNMLALVIILTAFAAAGGALAWVLS